jgi:hypothetical protein
MTTLLLVLLTLLAKVQGFRLLVIGPVPAALAVTIFAMAYFLSYSSNYIGVSLFVSLLALAAWVIGFGFCALVVLAAKRLPRTPS